MHRPALAAPQAGAAQGFPGLGAASRGAGPRKGHRAGMKTEVTQASRNTSVSHHHQVWVYFSKVLDLEQDLFLISHQ